MSEEMGDGDVSAQADKRNPVHAVFLTLTSLNVEGRWLIYILLL